MSFSKMNETVQDALQPINLFYIGTVVDNNDPLHLNRIRVSIPEIFDPTLCELPWCLPAKQSIFGQGKGYGVYGVPAINSKVMILLQRNDPNYPVYISSLMLHDSTGQSAGYDTPNKYGFVDPSGNKLFVDMEAGDWQFTHSSGASVHINKDNHISVFCKDVSVTADNSAIVQTKSASLTADTLHVDCPTSTFTGDISCKNLAAQSGITGTTVKASSEVSAGSVSLTTHTHGGVARDKYRTDPPA